jgi:hypothetical protein
MPTQLLLKIIADNQRSIAMTILALTDKSVMLSLATDDVLTYHFSELS